MDEAAVFKDRRSRRGFDVDRKIRQHATLGAGKGAGDEMKRGKRNESVAQAAQTVDRNSLG
jgi:hypothetical protein